MEITFLTGYNLLKFSNSIPKLSSGKEVVVGNKVNKIEDKVIQSKIHWGREVR